MTTDQIINMIILFIQVIILIGQLLLSRKINIQSISKDKGYFLIEDSNILVPKGEQGRFRDQFDLVNRDIGFSVIKGDVTLRSLSYSVNNVIYQLDKPADTFYTENSRFNKLAISLNLKDSDLQKDSLNIEFIFKLKNIVGYAYTEKINIRFSKVQNEARYIMEKYNMWFDK